MNSKTLSAVIKITASVLVLFAVYTLIGLQGQIAKKEEQAAALESEITSVQQEIRKTQERIDASTTDEGIAEIARDELGLAGTGEITFQDVGN